MNTQPTLLEGLYYPFSRCINVPSLKQLLLIFERIVFLDPVEDEDWRAKLYRDIETAGRGEFREYRNVYDVVPTLIAENTIGRVSPSDCKGRDSELTKAAALSDLLNEEWVATASTPDRNNLPYQSLYDGTPIWQAFLPKIPNGFVEAIQSDPRLQKHLLEEADEEHAWTLSYAAGSSASINLHLSAASEHSLAPVTDSELHHKLLLLKLMRRHRETSKKRPIDSKAVNLITQKVAVSVLSRILPEQSLETLDFEQLLKFREKSRSLRHQFVGELASSIALITRVPSPDDLYHAAHEIEHSLSKQVREYQAEFAGIRDRLWPSLAGSANVTLASGGVAALAMSYIGGPGYALAASVVASSLAVLKSALEVRGELKKLETSTSPAVSYLSRVARKLR